ncbi:alpha/beta-hydrolase [Aspergillus heteromorphus CBS 117.55]|uniref:Alpha/beta-hydrolase n=1 Tax=Aspergillus heteromorphus CBS 117.55 TaxID=1448321 RepID=A0A317V6B1_9EURO|nr:alpha/beta-hydrolase [Aspergillus heteromorphus CBS 117.55]PWY69059.1 alpha/beta-hydrolase [Aspergillus heteromorphus CBS 117.55]
MGFTSRALALALLVPGLLAAQCSNSSLADGLTVQTRTGVYTGVIEEENPNTRIFKSIAFAQPPVASRRWLPPAKLANSTTHHTTYHYPPSCPQYVSSATSLWNQYLGEGDMIYNGNQGYSSGLVGEATSEDCLYLAVWTPANATAASKLPVLFFMTGGAFTTGGIDINWQKPTSWVERTQEHIVVTINYRVNIFGWPNARGLQDQNLGIMDQRAALEWVSENIGQFGGDPARIVQWGQSAGSQSADFHSYAYHDKPLVSGYFMQSGTALKSLGFSDYDQTNFTFVAQQFGCDFPCDAQAELECMRQVPFAEISNFVGQYADNGTEPALSFSVVPDERLIFSDYPTRAAAGQIAHRPVIISNCANEYAALITYPVNNLTAGPDPAAVLEGDMTDWMCPTANTTMLRLHQNIPVYRYQNGGQYPNLNPFRWLGAYHASDLPMNFGTYPIQEYLGNSTALEAHVSLAMQDHILAFLQDPWTGPQSLGWEPVNGSTGSGGQVVRFGADGKAVQQVDRMEIDGPCWGIGKYDQFP